MGKVLTVAAVIAALGAAGFYYFFRWQPQQKTWCVLIYLVSKDANAQFQWPDASGQHPQNELDAKLDQVEQEINSVPSGSFIEYVKSIFASDESAPPISWDDVHLVYRAVWNDKPIREDGKPVARAKAVTWRPGAPTFPDDTTFAGSRAADRDGFIEWATQNFPAKHYAVFFWGHSIGPAGLFDLSTSVAFPPVPSTIAGTTSASLIDVATTVELLKTIRDTGAAPEWATTRLTGVGAGAAPVSTPGGSTASATSPGGTGTPPGSTALSRKVDVVLFQDCWMSTLETAFELRDLARYVVASQSIVPIGYRYDSSGQYVDPLGPAWPYTALITALLSHPDDFIVPLTHELTAFYDSPDADRAPFPVVPFTVMDLGEGNEIVTELEPVVAPLVKAFAAVPDRASRFLLLFPVSNRPVLIESNTNTLQGGESALVDLVDLCRRLEDPNTYTGPLSALPSSVVKDLQRAAIDLRRVLSPTGSSNGYSLIKAAFIAPTGQPAPPQLAFTGVSMLWLPSRQAPAGDPFIIDQIDGAFYESLQFVKRTKVTPQGPSWKQFAFEQP